MEIKKVILVNENDIQVGVHEKMDAHKKGLLHRAFSVFVFNSRGQMLLQQRSLSKYHSGGLWTNACCSHPAPGEETHAAVQRRLIEEMGIVTSVNKIFDFVYKAELDNDLTEYELDHVYIGEYEGDIHINREEVMDYCYNDVPAIRDSLDAFPKKYSAWFQIAFPRIEAWWKMHYKISTVPDANQPQEVES